MARAIKVGDEVYVPCSAFTDRGDLEKISRVERALYYGEVLTAPKDSKSVTIKMPDGIASQPVARSKIHLDVGVLILEIGDFSSEFTTLDPLAKSVLQFCRLLVKDEQARFLKCRSLPELRRYWATNQGAFTHVIIVGHGDATNLPFPIRRSYLDNGTKNTSGIAITDADPDEVSIADLVAALTVSGAKEKVFISLACKTGLATFARDFSKLSCCGAFLAPFHSVQGAIASQFCQTFLSSLFIANKTVTVAFKHAREGVPGVTSFRLWRKGDMLQAKVSKPKAAVARAAEIAPSE